MKPLSLPRTMANAIKADAPTATCIEYQGNVLSGIRNASIDKAAAGGAYIFILCIIMYTRVIVNAALKN